MIADTTNIGNIVNTCEVRWSVKTIESVTIDVSREICVGPDCKNLALIGNSNYRWCRYPSGY